MFPSGSGASTGITGCTGSVRAASLSGSKYFHISLGTEALVSPCHWSHDADSEKMTTSVLTFAMVLDAMLAYSRVVEDEEYRSDVAVKKP